MKKILIAEDSPTMRSLIVSTIDALGEYETVEAANGFEALRILPREKVDLIITDINMPHMDGMDFLGQLSQRHPDLNVIMMTAFGGVDSYLEAMNLGAYEYLYKPVKLDDLRSVMHKIALERANIA